MPSQIKFHNYVCSKCWNDNPSQRARKAKYWRTQGYLERNRFYLTRLRSLAKIGAIKL